MSSQINNADLSDNISGTYNFKKKKKKKDTYNFNALTPFYRA